MKLTPKQRQNYKKYIYSCIDIEDKENTVINLMKRFKIEAGWNIDRVGRLNALTEWIQGLPSCINIAFTNYEILQLAKKLGGIEKNPTEAQECKILDNYFNFIANYILQMEKAEAKSI